MALTDEQKAALEAAVLADQDIPTDAEFRAIRGNPKLAYWEQPDGTWWITNLQGLNAFRGSYTRGWKPDWAEARPVPPTPER